MIEPMALTAMAMAVVGPLVLACAGVVYVGGASGAVALGLAPAVVAWCNGSLIALAFSASARAFGAGAGTIGTKNGTGSSTIGTSPGGARTSGALVAAAALLCGASYVLLVPRVCVLAAGYWVQPWNVYTVVALAGDLYGASTAGGASGASSGTSGAAWVVLAYGMVLSGCKLGELARAGDSILYTVVLAVALATAVLAVVPTDELNVLMALAMVLLAGVGTVLAGQTKPGQAWPGGSWQRYGPVLVAAGSRLVLLAVPHRPTGSGASSIWAWVDLASPWLLAPPWLAPSSKFLHELTQNPDTKAILYFLVLNTTFMVVQLVYSFRLGSLGLLSDSLHMALDCSSLALGLVAGALARTPAGPGSKFPFGYGRFETLAGFTNGTLLVGISGGIVFEAVTRLMWPVELKGTTELVVVSGVGLGVNLVGIYAFGHHDHSHSHGHGGSQGHSHSHGHSHGHSHSHSHSHSHGSGSGLDEISEKTGPDGAGPDGAGASGASGASGGTRPAPCGDSSDNMHGIFLHILADTLGSVGVVVSTLLTKAFSWPGFDPVASLIIAVLIFLSAIPLIKSTSTSLLLALDKPNEQKIRSILTNVRAIKGVKGFTTPKFWPAGEGLTGYVHVQVYRGENSGFIKREVVALFGEEGVEVMVQMEFDYEQCWCR